jgi:hypothetical protein
MTHFSDDDIPPSWHRLNEVHPTTALRDFKETPQWHAFTHTRAFIDFMHAYPTRIREPHKLFSKGAKITTKVGLAASLVDLSRGGGYECDEQCCVTIHYMTLYMYSLLSSIVLFHRKDVLRGHVTTVI